jgi:DNA-directed RNA polymerase specialized sigma24 family protein
VPAPGSADAFADAADSFTAAELSDLRALVCALPISERAAVVMRYWQDASEGEVARGLGVSTRMVRYYLRRAYTRLRAGYTPEEERDGR